MKFYTTLALAALLGTAAAKVGLQRLSRAQALVAANTTTTNTTSTNSTKSSNSSNSSNSTNSTVVISSASGFVDVEFYTDGVDTWYENLETGSGFETYGAETVKFFPDPFGNDIYDYFYYGQLYYQEVYAQNGDYSFQYYDEYMDVVYSGYYTGNGLTGTEGGIEGDWLSWYFDNTTFNYFYSDSDNNTESIDGTGLSGYQNYYGFGYGWSIEGCTGESFQGDEPLWGW